MHMPAWIFCLSGLMTSVPPLSSPPSVANVHCDCTAECTSEEASGPPASRQIATGKHATLGSYLKSSAEYIDMSSAFSGLDDQKWSEWAPFVGSGSLEPPRQWLGAQWPGVPRTGSVEPLRAARRTLRRRTSRSRGSAKGGRGRERDPAVTPRAEGLSHPLGSILLRVGRTLLERHEARPLLAGDLRRRIVHGDAALRRRVEDELEVVALRVLLVGDQPERVLLEVDVVADGEGALQLRLRCRALRIVQVRQLGPHALQEYVLHLADVWYGLSVAGIHVELRCCRGTRVSARGHLALLLLRRSGRSAASGGAAAPA